MTFYDGNLDRVFPYDYHVMGKSKTIDKHEMVHKMWRQDFKCTEWFLHHHPPEHFTRCFWQKSERVLVWWILYRTVMAIYFLTTWLISFLQMNRIVPPEDSNKYWIFLTNWSYILETIYFVLAFIVIVIKSAQERKKDFEPGNRMPFMPWYYKMLWAIQSIILPASVVVTCIFWIKVYDPATNPLDVINFTTHVFNSIFMIVDFFLVAHPFRILHFYMPVAYAIVYVLFSLVYQLNGGTGLAGKIPIYEILDWRDPATTIITLLVANLFLIFVHVFFWFCHKLKEFLREKLKQQRINKYQEGYENHAMDVAPQV